MTLTAEIVLRSSSLPLVSIPASLGPDAIEYVHRRCLRPGRHMYIIQADARDDVSEDDLSALNEVVDAMGIGRASGKDIYRLTVELDEAIVRVFDVDLDGAPMENPVIMAEGCHDIKVLKNYNTLSEFQVACKANGVAAEIVSISSRPADSSDATTYGLTERHQEYRSGGGPNVNERVEELAADKGVKMAQISLA